MTDNPKVILVASGGALNPEMLDTLRQKHGDEAVVILNRLEETTQRDLAYLRDHPETPRLYDSGVRYAPAGDVAPLQLQPEISGPFVAPEMPEHKVRSRYATSFALGVAGALGMGAGLPYLGGQRPPELPSRFAEAIKRKAEEKRARKAAQAAAARHRKADAVAATAAQNGCDARWDNEAWFCNCTDELHFGRSAIVAHHEDIGDAPPRGRAMSDRGTEEMKGPAYDLRACSLSVVADLCERYHGYGSSR